MDPDLVLLAVIKTIDAEFPYYGLIIIYLKNHFPNLSDHIIKMIADLVWTVQEEIPF
jgi:hypothetical protein